MGTITDYLWDMVASHPPWLKRAQIVAEFNKDSERRIFWLRGFIEGTVLADHPNPTSLTDSVDWDEFVRRLEVRDGSG